MKTSDWELAEEGMHLVATGSRGTARRAFYGAKYEAAVKSGTAQVYGLKEGEKYNASEIAEHLRDHALLMGFAPLKDPKLIVAMVLENAGGGSGVGGPIAREIFDHVLVESKQQASKEDKSSMKMDPATGQNRSFFDRIHLDLPLVLGILLLMAMGLVIMYSASGQDYVRMDQQAMRMLLSLIVMFCLAQVNPRTLESFAPIMYLMGVTLLLGVLLFGEISKGAQRWLDLGFIRFQPSEFLKLAVPLMVARYIGKRPLPPTFRVLITSLVLVCLPTILIAKQPDLGTSILIAASGIL